MQIKDSKIGGGLPAFVANDDNFIIIFLISAAVVCNTRLNDKGL